MKKTATFALPEPQAVREIHDVRRRIQRRAEKLGWAKYLEKIDARPSLVAEPGTLALGERPKKDYNSQ